MLLPSMMIISLSLVIFLAMAIWLTAYKNNNLLEKKIQFECGFNSISKNKSSFSTKFFLVMILFLVFDLEIAILLPTCAYSSNPIYTLISSALFIIIITLITLIEWANGIIEWSK